MYDGHPIIDGDSHKVENWLILKDYLPKAYRHRIQAETCKRGFSRVALYDTDPKTGEPTYKRVMAKPEGPGKGLFAAFHPEGTMGGLFNRVRLEHMDREGVDLGIIYPTVSLGLNGLFDKEFALALARAYNDYIWDDVAPYRHRLFPAALIPVLDIDAALEEMRRCWNKGFIALAVPPCVAVPHPEAPDAFPAISIPKSISHKDFWPIFELAQSLGAPLGIHGAGPGMNMPGGVHDSTDNFMINHIFSHRNQMQLALTRCIFDGVFTAFPTLKVAFLEGGCGWLPDLAHALHEHWEKRIRDFDPDLQMDIKEYRRELRREVGVEKMVDLIARNGQNHGAQFVFKERGGALSRQHDRGDTYTWESALDQDPRDILKEGRIFLGFESDDPAITYITQAMGAASESIPMFSVDYGHWDGEVAGCVNNVTELDGVSRALKRKVLGENAVQFYGERLRVAVEAYQESAQIKTLRPSQPLGGARLQLK